MKKLLSVALAAVMALSLMVPALAVDRYERIWGNGDFTILKWS